MSWFLLVVAGLLEVVWATALKRVDEPLWLVIFLVGLAGSMGLLAVAVRDLPIGVAYTVWVGIGAVGAVLASIVVYGERLGAGQWLFLGLLIVGIVGLRLTTPEEAPASSERPGD